VSDIAVMKGAVLRCWRRLVLVSLVVTCRRHWLRSSLTYSNFCSTALPARHLPPMYVSILWRILSFSCIRNLIVVCITYRWFYGSEVKVLDSR